MRSAVLVFPFLAALLQGAVPSEAQHFGRNKVRWDRPRFRVLATAHFDIHHDESSEEAARIAARMAERWYERLRSVLGHDLRGRQPILLYAGHPDFQQTNAIAGHLPEATGGVTEAEKRRVVLPFAGPLAETDHVLGHELVHAFQYDMMGGGNRAALRLPLWFVEGMAEYLTLGPADNHTAMWMRDAARSGRLPRVRDLDQPRYFPYRFGHAFWAYVGERWGDAAVGRVLKTAARSRRDVVRVLERVLEIGEEPLSRDWHASVRQAYGEDGVRPAGPEAFGRPFLASTKKGTLDLAPALSPDGRRLAFLSDREGGSLDLFLADAETGRVEGRALERRLEARYDSVQFVASAGAWDAAGRRFAFAAVRRGRAVLALVDVAARRLEREIAIPRVDEILNPSFSPDGGKVAFSALRGGFSDLYVYDLATGALEALTDDPFADLQPVWSPDGTRLAFVTDRFDTDLDHLRWGHYRLAELVLASGAVSPLPCFHEAKNVDPQWGADGRVLYFLSDQNGVSNVYRLEVATGALRQVTDVGVGISGLTDTSPALASAAAGHRLVVAAFSRGRHHLHSIEQSQVLAGTEPDPAPEPHAAAPSDALRPNAVQALLQDPARGLPAGDTPRAAAYQPRLTTNGLADPYLSVASDRFGLAVYGGASLFWSDLLGNHSLGASLQMEGGPRDLSGFLAYENRTRRWTWGVAAQQRTWRGGIAGSSRADLDGGAVVLERLVRYRETDRGLLGHVAYPFDREHRLELSAGVRQAWFSGEERTRTSSLETGRRLGEQTEALPAPEPLALVEMGAAFVHDSSAHGPASPVSGRRYRLQVTPTLGTKPFVGVLLDYRRYWRPLRPLTLAARALHVARYGAGADDPRLPPLYAGYAPLVRGYDSLGSPRCLPGAGCERLDELVGSRLLVGNAELRVPAFVWLRRDRPYGPVPAELAFFFDAGTTWTNDSRPSGLGGSRRWIRSWGAAVRVNLFGFATGELDYVRPLDLAGTSGPVWRFRLGRGF